MQAMVACWSTPTSDLPLVACRISKANSNINKYCVNINSCGISPDYNDTFGINLRNYGIHNGTHCIHYDNYGVNNYCSATDHNDIYGIHLRNYGSQSRGFSERNIS